MAGRIRSIKPEILEDEEAAGLSDSAWRLWVSIWTLVDDHGNCRASAKWLSGQVWWVSGRAPEDVEALIMELVSARRITLYTVRGERYLHVRNWDKHQRIDNAGKARVPTPDEEGAVPFRGEPPRTSAIRGSDLRPPTSDSDPEGISHIDRLVDGSPQGSIFDPPAPKESFDFEAVYAKYPRKLGKKKGLQRCRSRITTRKNFDAFVRAVENYSASVAGKDPEYVKHFDTFVSCWEDFVDYQPLRSNSAARVTGYIPASEEERESGDVTHKL